MNIQWIESLDDARVANYRNLRDRKLRYEGLFITEGALLAERLLPSRFPIESLLVTQENAERFAALLQEFGHKSVPIYVTQAALMRDIVGFDFHRGVLAIGRRLQFPDVKPFIEDLALRHRQIQLIACPGTESSENLGLIIRSAAAFGVQGVLLPIVSADPLSRRCLRQSMGSALTLPIATSPELLSDLCALRESVGLRLVAAVADENSDVTPLPHFNWPERAVLIVGNEFHGLDASWLQHCDYQVTIPVAPGHDSLNVAVATGVLLYDMRCAANASSGAPNAET